MLQAMQLQDYDVELDLQHEGFPLSTCHLVRTQLEYLRAHEAVREGRRLLELRVRAETAEAARSYARQRVALELRLLTTV